MYIYLAVVKTAGAPQTSNADIFHEQIQFSLGLRL